MKLLQMSYKIRANFLHVFCLGILPSPERLGPLEHLERWTCAKTPMCCRYSPTMVQSITLAKITRPWGVAILPSSETHPNHPRTRTAEPRFAMWSRGICSSHRLPKERIYLPIHQHTNIPKQQYLFGLSSKSPTTIAQKLTHSPTIHHSVF